MKKYTLKNPSIIKTVVPAPLEYTFEKCFGVLGGKQNREKSFTPRWLSSTVEESIEVIRPETKGGKYHLGIAVTPLGLDNGGNKIDLGQFAIIDAGYLWDEINAKSETPTKMVFQVRSDNYNARVIFEKIDVTKTSMTYIEWGTKKGLTKEDISNQETVEKFASEVEKQFNREKSGKDCRNLKKVSLVYGKLKTEMLRGHDAARARRESLNKILGKGK